MNMSGPVVSRFADIIWQNEPISRSEIAALAEKELGWKRTTSYTVLTRLIERGFFLISGKTVTSRISREEFYAQKSEKFLEETFDGSLPAFLVAFGSRNKLSDEEVEELKKVIDSLRR